MKKLIALLLALVMIMSLAACGGDTKETTGGNESSTTEGGAENNETAETYLVGICQLMEHESLDQATQGFKDALIAELGENVQFEEQVAGEANLCTTVINALIAKDVDLIMGNATPALLAAANATTSIPVLGTSVTDYDDTFKGNIPENVSGTSDAVPFDEQAQMMIDTLNLVAGDQVGVLYCINESNSAIQYEAVKALFEAEGIVVEAYTFSETTELQALVTNACGECKAIYVPSDNTVAENDAAVGTICEEYNIPVYTSYGGAICYASLAISYYDLGYRTGEMAAQILKGEKTPADIDIETLTPSVVYNDELCQKLGIEVPEN